MSIFEITIHSKQNLTAIQKLHYLKTDITGEAADSAYANNGCSLWGLDLPQIG